MQLTHILVFIGFCLLYRAIPGIRWRSWFLFIASLLALYWLQPATPIRYLDYWLPTVTLILASLGWLITRPISGVGQKTEIKKPRTEKDPLTEPQLASPGLSPRPQAAQIATAPSQTAVEVVPYHSGSVQTKKGIRLSDNWLAAGAMSGIALAVALLRYLPIEQYLTPTRPPQLLTVAVMLVVWAALGFFLYRLYQHRNFVGLLTTASIALIVLLVILKTPQFGELVSAGLRALSRQSIERADAFDIRWLGFSYLAFRLIHTFRDRQAGRLPTVNLREYLTYMVFFPAVTAGPIDRIERFVKDLRQLPGPATLAVLDGGYRLAIGMFKKFVLADSLALFALNSQNALQVEHTGWTWVLLYAYAFQIFFDFAGYTDIAIGLAIMLGIKLPENFNAPYLKPNLTQFWNNWHMTLTQWFRAYYFNPVTRSLRKKKVSPTAIIFFTQVSTMILIGLWHGVTLNFILWGLWHGLGQFIQNRYSEWVKPAFAQADQNPALQRILSIASGLLTFHYVALGWVFFALPTLPMATRIFARLFGME